jgi:hypothetical protein
MSAVTATGALRPEELHSGRSSMRRHAYANPFVRRQLNRLLDEIKSKAASEWPRRSNLAWRILHEFPIIFSAASAAHVCAQAINRRIGNIVEFQMRNKLRKVFERIAKCTKRAPAELRHRLDAAIIPLIQKEHVDLEVIEEIFDAVVKVFSEYSHHEAAKTALVHRSFLPHPTKSAGLSSRSASDVRFWPKADFGNVQQRTLAAATCGN